MGNAGYLSPSDLARAETRDLGPQSPELYVGPFRLTLSRAALILTGRSLLRARAPALVAHSRANRPDHGLPPTATLYELSSVPEAEPSVLGSYTASRRPLVEPTSAIKPRLYAHLRARRRRRACEPDLPLAASPGVGHARRSAPVLAADAGATPWVTVFGFPPSLAMSVLRDFQAIGDVAQYQPGEGAPPSACCAHRERARRR